jgi:endonuclease/exonuclease/phosphatase family metal-dependent hydrolase
MTGVIMTRDVETLRIVTLNTWGGRAGKDELLQFFEREKDNVDIFCLQEIWRAPYHEFDGVAAGGVSIDHTKILTDGLQKISAQLPDHVAYFRPSFGDNYGLLTLVRKSLVVSLEGDHYVHKDKSFVPVDDIGEYARNIQYVTLRIAGEPVTVCNFHGLWNGRGKTDSPDRILQSKNIVQFLSQFSGAHIVCGDFNLLPDTTSVQILEDAGLVNLITAHGVTSTRTHFYTKPEKFADYIFVSPDVEVKNFRVLPDAVSDHAPLFLDVRLA